MRFFLTLLVLAGLALRADSAPPSPRPLEPLLRTDNLWAALPARFTPPNASYSFHWTSPGADTLRTTLPGITLFDIPVTAMTARFQAKTLRAMEAVFYDQAANGELSHKEFEALRKQCVAGVSAFTKSSPIGTSGEAAASASPTKVETKEWRTPAIKYVLECGSVPQDAARNTPFRAEFIRLEMTPPEKP